MRRHFKDSFSCDLVDAFCKSPKLLFRISGEYYFRMITFQCNYLLAVNFGFYAEARYVERLVNRSKRTFRTEVSSRWQSSNSSCNCQDIGYTLTYTHKLYLTFNKIICTLFLKVMQCIENFCRKCSLNFQFLKDFAD